MTTEEYPVVLERHEQKLRSIQKQLDELKDVQREIKVMNQTLVEITNEIKHTNAALYSCETKINEMQQIPASRWEKIVTALLSSVLCGIAGYVIGKLFT